MLSPRTKNDLKNDKLYKRLKECRRVAALKNEKDCVKMDTTSTLDQNTK